MASLAQLLVVLLAVSIRIWLAETSVSEWLSERNEVVTPLTSWKRGKSLCHVGAI